MFTFKNNFSQTEKKLNKIVNDKVRPIITQEILKQTNKYVPLDLEELQRSSFLSSDFKKGRLVWNTKYARRIYNLPIRRIKKKKNRFARSFWWDYAKKHHQKRWAKQTQMLIKEVLKKKP